MATRRRRCDVTTTNHGTVWSFQLHTRKAREFVTEQCEVEDWQWLGSSLVVDHRPARELVDVMRMEGLEVR